MGREGEMGREMEIGHGDGREMEMEREGKQGVEQRWGGRWRWKGKEDEERNGEGKCATDAAFRATQLKVAITRWLHLHPKEGLCQEENITARI
jgi:hypothetical protein